MAKKAIPLENCVFCGERPCTCAVVSREKQVRQALREHDEEEVHDGTD